MDTRRTLQITITKYIYLNKNLICEMNVQVSNMSWGFTKAYSILPFYAYIQYIKSSQFNTVRHVVKCTLVQ